MENTENNPVVEEAVVETPVVEALVVETPPVLETPAEPAHEEPEVELPKEEVPAAVEQEAIHSPSYPSTSEEVPALGAVDNGVMGSTTVSRPERKVENVSIANEVEKVAIHSTKNVAWQGVGKVSRGYNIVTKDAAQQWLTRSHVRVATPEEVKKAFG